MCSADALTAYWSNGAPSVVDGWMTSDNPYSLDANNGILAVNGDRYVDPTDATVTWTVYKFRRYITSSDTKDKNIKNGIRISYGYHTSSSTWSTQHCSGCFGYPSTTYTFLTGQTTSMSGTGGGGGGTGGSSNSTSGGSGGTGGTGGQGSSAGPADVPAAIQSTGDVFSSVPIHVLATIALVIPLLCISIVLSCGWGKRFFHSTLLGHLMLHMPMFELINGKLMQTGLGKLISKIRGNFYWSWIMEWPLSFLYELTFGEFVLGCTFILINLVWLGCGIIRDLPMLFQGYPVKAIANAFGLMATFNLSVVIVPVTRHSWVYVLGLSFDRNSKAHRFVAETMLITFAIHGILMIVHYAVYDNANFANIFHMSTDDTRIMNLAGWIGFFAFAAMAAMANKIIRWKMFSLFYWSHYILGILAISFTLAHAFSSIAPYMAASLILFGFDLFLRLLFNWFIANTRVLQISQNDKSKVITMVLKPRASIRSIKPGQHVYLWCRNVSHSPETHPFSISSVDPQESILTLHIKDGSRQYVNAFTSKLRTLANRVQNGEIALNQVKMSLEGPYGKLTIRPDSYNTIVLFAGGIGITPMLAILERFTHKIRLGRTKKLRHIILHWIVPDESIIEDIESIMQKVRQYSAPVQQTPTGEIKNTKNFPVDGRANLSYAPDLHFYVTKRKKKQTDGQQVEMAEQKREHEVSGCGVRGLYSPETFHDGRCDFDDALIMAQRKAVEPHTRFIGVLTCGPMGMIHSIEHAVWKANSNRTSSQQIFQLHKDVFNV